MNPSIKIMCLDGQHDLKPWEGMKRKLHGILIKQTNKEKHLETLRKQKSLALQMQCYSNDTSGCFCCLEPKCLNSKCQPWLTLRSKRCHPHVFLMGSKEVEIMIINDQVFNISKTLYTRMPLKICE